MLPAFFHLEDGGFCPPGAKTGPKGKENEKKPGLRSADFEHKKMAERGGFEPPEGYPSSVFKTDALNRSTISPRAAPGWMTRRRTI